MTFFSVAKSHARKIYGPLPFYVCLHSRQISASFFGSFVCGHIHPISNQIGFGMGPKPELKNYEQRMSLEITLS